MMIGTKHASRLIVGLVALTFAAACGGTSPSAGDGTTAPPTAQTKTVAATVKEFAIGLTPTTVAAGAIHFDVSNTGTAVHEFVVLRTELAPDALPMKPGGSEANEDANGIENVGEVEDVQPGSSKGFDVTLAAGNYVVMCNLPAHYAAGMRMAFTVA